MGAQGIFCNFFWCAVKVRDIPGSMPRTILSKSRYGTTLGAGPSASPGEEYWDSLSEQNQRLLTQVLAYACSM